TRTPTRACPHFRTPAAQGQRPRNCPTACQRAQSRVACRMGHLLSRCPLKTRTTVGIRPPRADRARAARTGSAMSEGIKILDAIRGGEPRGAGELLPLVYDELRRLAASRLAHEAAGQTLNATALVHEAYLRLVGGEPDRPWDGRG